MTSPDHNAELHRLAQFCLTFAALLAVPYVLSPLSALKPWLPGEPIPLLGLLEQRVVLDGLGNLRRDAQSRPAPSVTPTETVTWHDTGAADTGFAESADTGVQWVPWYWPPTDVRLALPERPPAQHSALEVPPGALDAYFSALSVLEDGHPEQMVRALVWGDSTIAADHVIADVRRRMQDRFGNGGPGFLALQVDPYWSLRSDVVRSFTGTWQNDTLVSGGSPDARYGLAGVASTTAEASTGRLVLIDRQAPPIRRMQVFYLRQPGGGTVGISMRGGGIRTTTDAEQRYDVISDVAVNGHQVNVTVDGDGPVTLFGAALETEGPGVTWETLGLAGSTIATLNRQGRRHLQAQITARQPDLLVYWTGGNELGYESLQDSDGATYRRIYRRVIDKLRSGAPDASCLLIGPLDQATRFRGQIVSKAQLDVLIPLQRQVAREANCAYWDARDAMGGDGAFQTWMEHEPPLAVPDLMHLTKDGGSVIGEVLADILLASYDHWRDGNPGVGWSPPESPDTGPLFELLAAPQP